MPLDISLALIPGDPAWKRPLAAAPRSDAEAVGVVAAETASTMDGRELFGPSATPLDGNSGGAPEYVSKDPIAQSASSR